MKALARFVSWLDDRTRSMRAAIVGIRIGTIAVAEAIAPREASIEFLHLIPVVLAAWSLGERSGLVTGLIAAIVPLLVEMSLGSRDALGPSSWNALLAAGALGTVAIVVARLRIEIDRLQILAATDELTGVANGRTFHERCRIEINRSQRFETPLTLIYIDLDNFKNVNDEIGHLAGDAVLRIVADVVKKNVRPYDVVARMGGDEFAVLFPAIDEAAAALVRERIRDVISESMARRGLPVTCSIGSVTFHSMPKDTDDLIRVADDAMIEAKRRGKNMIVHRVL